MVLVRILKPAGGHHAGETVDLPGEEVALLLAGRRVELIRPEAETTDAPSPELAIARRRPKGR